MSQEQHGKRGGGSSGRGKGRNKPQYQQQNNPTSPVLDFLTGAEKCLQLVQTATKTVKQIKSLSNEDNTYKNTRNNDQASTSSHRGVSTEYNSHKMSGNNQTHYPSHIVVHHVSHPPQFRPTDYSNSPRFQVPREEMQPHFPGPRQPHFPGPRQSHFPGPRQPRFPGPRQTDPRMLNTSTFRPRALLPDPRFHSNNRMPSPPIRQQATRPNFGNQNSHLRFSKPVTVIQPEVHILQQNNVQRSISTDSGQQSTQSNRYKKKQNYSKQKYFKQNQQNFWKNRKKSKQQQKTESQQPSLFSFSRAGPPSSATISDESDDDTMSVISSCSFKSDNEDSDEETSTILSANSDESKQSSMFNQNDYADLKDFEIIDKKELPYVENPIQQRNPFAKESFISVFWDIENCPVPHDKSALDIVQKVRNSFYGDRTEEEFIVACDTRNLNKFVERELSEAYVNLIHANSENKNAADSKLKRVLQKFQDRHRLTNSAIVLISGDSDFSDDLHSLRYQHHVYINLVCNEYARRSLRVAAHKCILYSDFVRDLPSRLKDDLFYCIVITNLPAHVKANAIKANLEEQIKSINGKVRVISNTQAEMIFLNHCSFQKAMEKLKDHSVFGSEITLREEIRHSDEKGNKPKKTKSKSSTSSSHLSSSSIETSQSSSGNKSINIDSSQSSSGNKSINIDSSQSSSDNKSLSIDKALHKNKSISKENVAPSSSKTQNEEDDASKKATLYIFVSHHLGDQQYWKKEFNEIFSEKNSVTEMEKVEWLENDFERYFLVTFKSLSKAQKAKKLLVKHQVAHPSGPRFVKIVKQIESINLPMTEARESDPMEITRKKIEDHVRYIKDKEARCLTEHKVKIKELKDFHNKRNNTEDKLAYEDKCNELNEQQISFTAFTEKICQTLRNLTGSENEIEEKINDLMREYSRECTCLRTALPIYAKRNAILKKIKASQVIVLQAATGSGKSTQICQYLWREGYGENGLIVCTQPRKIAAVSIAKHVSSQVGCTVGNIVGYRVGITKRMNDKTKILYVTDFTMLKMCAEDPFFNGISCIMIDEAHERSVYTDLLLGMVKKVLVSKPDLRVIITSATLQTTLFQDYFNLSGNAVFQLPGRTFPIEDIWVEENIVLDYEYINKGYFTKIINKTLEIVQQEKGDILAFLVTPSDTEKAVNVFNELLKQKNIKSDIRVLQLHGKLDVSEQHKIFEKTPHNARKIVFSTNCAETSITIPGIKFVIDCGMVKEAQYDEVRNLNVLSIGFTNRSSAEQRRGRAGRTQSGKCFRLYSKSNYETDMLANMVPEILKVNLGQALLKLMILGVENPTDFDFIQSPSINSMSKAMKQLTYLGAVNSTDGSLTNFGERMSVLPLEPRLCYLILKGIEKDIGYDALVTASLATVSRNIFFRNSENSKEADVKKIRFCQSESDFFTFLEVFKEWSEVPKAERSRWCVLNCINARSLRLAHDLVNELIFTLSKELNQKISTKFSAENNFTDIMHELIFQSYSENICIFSGVHNFGYLSLDVPDNLFIHPSSSLYSLGKWRPQYIVYDTILKTSQTFLINITAIQETTIITAFCSGLLQVDIGRLQNMILTPYIYSNLGEIVLKTLLSKSKLKKLDKQLKDCIDGKPCATEVDFSYGKLSIFVPQECTDVIDSVFLPPIEEVKSRLLLREKELNEIDRLTNLRIILGAGIEVKEILLPGEFREVKVTLENCTFSQVTQKFKECGEIKYIQNGNKFHRILFQKHVSAQTAIKMFENDQNVTVQPLDIPTCNSSMPFFRIMIHICRRKCANKAFISIEPQTCFVEACNALLTRDIFYGSSRLNINISKKDIQNLCVAGLPDVLDTTELRSILNKHLPRDLKVGKLIPLLQPPFPTSNEEYEAMKQRILDMFNPFTVANKVRIDLKKPHIKDKDWQALVFFENPQDGQVAVNILKSRKSCLSDTEKSILKLRAILETTLMCHKDVFAAIKDQIEDAVKYFNKGTNQDDELTINARSKDEINVIIQIKSNNIADINDARNRLMTLIQGDQILCSGKPELEKLFTDRGQTLLKNLVAKQPNSHVSFDHRRKILSLYGSDAACTFIKINLESFLNEIEKDDFEEISLRCKNSPNSILKEIIVKYGFDLVQLRAACYLSSAEIDARRHILTAFGTKRAISKCKELISQIQSNFTSDNFLNDTDVETCPVCQSEVDSSYHRLEYCGHVYCKVCLLLQITSCDSFPLCCCKDDCGELIVLEDIQWAIKGGQLKEKELYTKAFANFMLETTEFKYCPTRDCPMVYRITIDKDGYSEFTCPQCSNNICTRCCESYHIGMSCNFYQRFKGDNDYSLKVWEELDPKNHKLCPSCSVPIEKNGGCMHMTCWKCKCHMCWGCMRTFPSGDDVYSHQDKCPETLRLMFF